MDELKPIDNPLEWQAMIDSHGIGTNLRGSARFWLTVAEFTGLRIWQDGAPEFTQMIIELKEGLGLLLTGDPWSYEPDEPDFTGAWIDYKFVALNYEKPYWPISDD